MAIVKMKKLHVIAMADRREELLKGLLHLGCVEISEPREVLADPQWASLFQRSGSSLAERKGQLTDVNTALDAIKQYAKLKDGMFIKRHPITEAEFLDAGAAEKAQAACDAVREQLGILTKAQSEAGRLESREAVGIAGPSAGAIRHRSHHLPSGGLPRSDGCGRHPRSDGSGGLGGGAV